MATDGIGVIETHILYSLPHSVTVLDREVSIVQITRSKCLAGCCDSVICYLTTADQELVFEWDMQETDTDTIKNINETVGGVSDEFMFIGRVGRRMLDNTMSVILETIDARQQDVMVVEI